MNGNDDGRSRGITDNEPGTLVVTRRCGEAVLIGPPGAQVRVSFEGMKTRGKARIAITAPRVIPIWREEIAEAAMAARAEMVTSTGLTPTSATHGCVTEAGCDAADAVENPLAGTVWAGGVKGGAD